MTELVITARASSLPAFADCPARWAAMHLDGLTLPPSPRAALGSAIHASTTVYDQHLINADPVRVEDAAAVAVDYLRTHHSEVDWRADDQDLRPSDAERIALALHGRYCTEIAPTRTYTACEVDLGVLEIEVEPGVIVRLTGHGDRIREEGGAEIVSDLKSGKTAVRADGTVETKGHAAQTATYKLLRHASTGKPMHRLTEIIGLQTGKSADTQRVGVGIAEDVEEALLGTGTKPGLLHSLGFMAKRGIFHGNPNSRLCSPRFCPIYHHCHYRK